MHHPYNNLIQYSSAMTSYCALYRVNNSKYNKLRKFFSQLSMPDTNFDTESFF